MESNNLMLKTILATLGVVLTVIFVIAWFSPSENKVAPTPSPTVEPTFKPYMNVSNDDIRDGFVSGCMEDGTATEDQCNCLYNHVLADLGKEDLMKYSIEYVETNKMNGLFIDSASEATYCFN